LIHHLTELPGCFQEANRVLKPGGVFIVQDRTPGDFLLPGDERHIRGYFFEKFPKLIGAETSRRHNSEQVRQALESSGFRLEREVSLWETRRVYPDFESLRRDLLLRTGRSILHELTDAELRDLISYIEEKLGNPVGPIVEQDAWTVWFAVKREEGAAT